MVAHELALSLRAPFGMEQPSATILSLEPVNLTNDDGNAVVRIGAWREEPANAAGDCVHLVLVNSQHEPVRFSAHIGGLIAPWDSFKWPCDCPDAGDVCDICFARRLFVSGPQLNISANGTLEEGWLGPRETAVYRIGCATPGTHPWISPQDNLANNPSAFATSLSNGLSPARKVSSNFGHHDGAFRLREKRWLPT